MTERNILQRNRVHYWFLETNFGEVPAGSFPFVPTKVILTQDEVGFKLVEDMLENPDETLYREENRAQIHGLKIGSTIGPMSQLLKATKQGSQLTSGGAVGSLTPRIALTAAFGNERAALGTTVSNGGGTATETVFDVASATNIKKGSFILVAINGEMEWTKVVNVASTTVTALYPLSAPPADAAAVRNLYNYCPADNHTTSMGVYQGWRSLGNVDTTAEFILLGIGASVVFKFGEYGKLFMMDVSGQVTTFTGPASSGSIDTTTVVVDDMGVATKLAPSIYLVAGGGSLVRTSRLVCEKYEFAHANQWQMVRDGGAPETVASIVNVGGRPRASTAKFQCRYDQALNTGYDADTDYAQVCVQKIGSGLTASFWIWEIPKARFIEKPQYDKMGELLSMSASMGGLPDDTVTYASETGADRDFIFATSRVAFG